MPWRSPHRALFLAMVVNLVWILTAAGASVGAARANCSARVDTRDDNRAMWLWLVEQFPGDELAGRARVQLDDRLPELECKGVFFPNLTPVTEKP